MPDGAERNVDEAGREALQKRQIKKERSAAPAG